MRTKCFYLFFKCVGLFSFFTIPLSAERIYTSEHVYETGKLLGKGKRGKVLRARDELGRLFAVKVMYTKEEQKRRGCPEPEIKHMFDSEGISKTAERAFEIGLAMDHPGIIKCYELTVQNDKSWTVLEYVEGTPLNKIGPNKFTRSQIVTLALDYVDALSYAASIHIVHRDLCTQNLMVDTNNRLKLIDLDSFQSLLDERIKKSTKAHRDIVEKINWVFIEILRRGQLPEKDFEDYFQRVMRLPKHYKYQQQMHMPLTAESGSFFKSYFNSLKQIIFSQEGGIQEAKNSRSVPFW